MKTPEIVNRGDSTDVLLYDFIGLDVRASDFVRNLKAITTPTINLRINSPGGLVNDGLAIYHALKGHKSKIIANIEGFCLSAATYPALAADEVVMNTGTMWMVHDVQVGTYGNGAELRKQAELAERMQEQVVNVYVEATGIDAGKIRNAMNAETWWTAEEAVDFGWADRTSGDSSPANVVDLMQNFRDLPEFHNLPDSLKNVTRSPSVRQVERALKAAGIPQVDAKAMASDWANRARQRDVDAAHSVNQRDVDWLTVVGPAYATALTQSGLRLN